MKPMQKITPFLWFEKDMKEIVDFYTSIFPGARRTSGGELTDTPSGTVQTATLEIFGQEFNLMTAGPYNTFNPTVSFIISCDSDQEIDMLWGALSKTGKVLMELGSYPFAEKYGWLKDRYGVSWQLISSSTMKSSQKIIPTLMFAGNVCGRAEEAVNFYTSVFPHSKVEYLNTYGPEEKAEPKALVKHSSITITGSRIALMDSGRPSPLSFEQAISFVVSCEDQKEVDYYWKALGEGGEEIQCGWLKDRFGFPWQIVPTALGRMLNEGSEEQISRVTAAFLKMKKFDILKLEEAFSGVQA